MDDFYSRTGERYSIKSPEKEESWVVWVGGAMIGGQVVVRQCSKTRWFMDIAR